MSWTKIADVAVGIPYGDGTRKRWKNVGALLSDSHNDDSKGPGFVIALDATFSPAGAPQKDGSVMLSCFHPKPDGRTPEAPLPRGKPLPDFTGDESDIPF